MANLIRAAKFGSEWTSYDLNAYHIKIEYVRDPGFFGTDEMPPSSVDQEVLTVQDADGMVSDRNAELIALLNLAMRSAPHEESVGSDFLVALFQSLGYVSRTRVARTRRNISFVICGERKHARSDVCLVKYPQNEIILVVQEDRQCLGEPPGAECQLVAAAIAAFDHNNTRRREFRLPLLESMVMPGIVLHDTVPIFYKIPVTTELVRHVLSGLYPSKKTVVSAYVPPVPRPLVRYDQGMKPLDNRQAILRSYEAFKSVVGI